MGYASSTNKQYNAGVKDKFVRSSNLYPCTTTSLWSRACSGFHYVSVHFIYFASLKSVIYLLPLRFYQHAYRILRMMYKLYPVACLSYFN